MIRSGDSADDALFTDDGAVYHFVVQELEADVEDDPLGQPSRLFCNSNEVLIQQAVDEQALGGGEYRSLRRGLEAISRDEILEVPIIAEPSGDERIVLHPLYHYHPGLKGLPEAVHRLVLHIKRRVHARAII